MGVMAVEKTNMVEYDSLVDKIRSKAEDLPVDENVTCKLIDVPQLYDPAKIPGEGDSTGRTFGFNQSDVLN